MTARYLAPIAAVLLAAALTGCTADTVEADDPRPATSDTASPSEAPGAHADGLSLAHAIAKIPIAEESRDGYERDAFKHWVDEDSDGCSTRMETLIAESRIAPTIEAGCKVTAGEWYSYYDAVTVTDPSKLDIDHMGPLAEAWDSGASAWMPERREAYANDLDAERSLVAVTAKTNRSKADQDPATWLPPLANAHCTYISDWISTKLRWQLSADQAEREALTRIAKDCGRETVKYKPAP